MSSLVTTSASPPRQHPSDPLNIVVVEDDATIANTAENWYGTQHNHRKVKQHPPTPPPEPADLAAMNAATTPKNNNNTINTGGSFDSSSRLLDSGRGGAAAAVRRRSGDVDDAVSDRSSLAAGATDENGNPNMVGGGGDGGDDDAATRTLISQHNLSAAQPLGLGLGAMGGAGAADDLTYQLPFTNVLKHLLAGQKGYHGNSAIMAAAVTTTNTSSSSTSRKANSNNTPLATTGVSGGGRVLSSAAVAIKSQELQLGVTAVDGGAGAARVPKTIGAGGGVGGKKTAVHTPVVGGIAGESAPIATAVLMADTNNATTTATTAASNDSPPQAGAAATTTTLIAGSIIPSRFLRKIRCQWDARKELQELLIRFRESIVCIHTHATAHFHLWEEALYEIYSIHGSTRSKIRARLPKREWQRVRERQQREEREARRLQRLTDGEHLFVAEEEEERLLREAEDAENPPLPDREHVERAARLYERSIRRCNELLEELATHIGTFSDRFVMLMRCINAEVAAVDWLNAFEEMLDVFENRLPTFHNDSLLDFAMEVPPVVMDSTKLNVKELCCFSAEGKREKVRPRGEIPVDFAVTLKNKVTFEQRQKEEALKDAIHRRKEEAAEAEASALQAAAEATASQQGPHGTAEQGGKGGNNRSGSPSNANTTTNNGRTKTVLKNHAAAASSGGAGAAATTNSSSGENRQTSTSSPNTANRASSPSSTLERKPSNANSVSSGGGGGDAGAVGRRSSLARRTSSVSLTGGGGGGGGKPPMRRGSLVGKESQQSPNANNPLSSQNTSKPQPPAEGASRRGDGSVVGAFSSSSASSPLSQLPFGGGAGVGAIDEKDTVTYRMMRSGLIHNKHLASLGGSADTDTTATTSTTLPAANKDGGKKEAVGTSSSAGGTSGSAVNQSKFPLLSALPYTCDIVASCADHTDPFLTTLYIATSTGAVLSVPFASVTSMGREQQPPQKQKGGEGGSEANVDADTTDGMTNAEAIALATTSSTSSSSQSLFDKTRNAIATLLTGYPFPLPTPSPTPLTAAQQQREERENSSAHNTPSLTAAAAADVVSETGSQLGGVGGRRTSSGKIISSSQQQRKSTTSNSQPRDPKATAKAERLRKQEAAAAAVQAEKDAKVAALNAIKAEAAARLPIKVPPEYQTATTASAGDDSATAADAENEATNISVVTSSGGAAVTNASLACLSSLATTAKAAPPSQPRYLDGVRLFDGHLYPAHLLEYLPSIGMLVSAAGDKTLRIHDAKTGKLVNIIADLRGLPAAVCYHRDMEAIIVGTYAGELRMYDPRTKAIVGRMDFSQPIHSLCFDAVLSVLFVGTRRGHVYGFKLAIDALFYRPRLEPLSDDGQTQDCVYCFLPVAEADAPLAYPIDRSTCTVSVQHGEGAGGDENSSMMMIGGGGEIGSQTNTVEHLQNQLIYNAATTAKKTSAKTSRSTAITKMVSVAFYLFVGDATGKVHQWDLAAGEYVRRYYSHSDDITDIVVTVDGILFTSSKDALVIIWSLIDGGRLKVINRHYGGVSGIFLGYLGGDHTPNGQQRGEVNAPASSAATGNQSAGGKGGAVGAASSSLSPQRVIDVNSIGVKTPNATAAADGSDNAATVASPGYNIFTQRRIHGNNGGGGGNNLLLNGGGGDDDDAEFGNQMRALNGARRSNANANNTSQGGGYNNSPSSSAPPPPYLSASAMASPVTDASQITNAPVARPFLLIPNYADDTEIQQQLHSTSTETLKVGNATPNNNNNNNGLNSSRATSPSASYLNGSQQRKNRANHNSSGGGGGGGSGVTGFTIGDGQQNVTNSAAISLALLRGEVPQGVDLRELQGSRECIRVTVHNPPVLVTTSTDQSVVTWTVQYND